MADHLGRHGKGGDSDSSSSSDGNVPERRRRYDERPPKSERKRGKNSERVKPPEKINQANTSLRNRRGKKGGPRGQKITSGTEGRVRQKGIYKPPGVVGAGQKRVKWERLQEKERISEFTRDYGDDSDEERPTLRRERINELKYRLSRLERGTKATNRTVRRVNVQPHNSPPSRSRQPYDHGRNNRAPLSTTESNNSSGRRSRVQAQKSVPRRKGEYRVRKSRPVSMRDDVESFDNAALMLLNQTVKTVDSGYNQASEDTRKMFQCEICGSENPGSSSVDVSKGMCMICYQKSHRAENGAKGKRRTTSEHPGRRKDRDGAREAKARKTSTKQQRSKSTAERVPTTERVAKSPPTAPPRKQKPLTKRALASKMFSLLKNYKKTDSKAPEAQHFDEAVAGAVPVKSSETEAASQRMTGRGLTDHQKLFDLAEQMEVRLKKVKAEQWGDNAAEAASIRSDLRDIYVDITMRAPEYALLKDVVQRMWMTFYREIERLKALILGQKNESARETLNVHLANASKFFRGLVECVCVRFDLYPAEASSGRTQNRLRRFMREQYGELQDVKDRVSTVCRIVSELYIALGDIELYRILVLESKSEAERASTRRPRSKGKAANSKLDRIKTSLCEKAKLLYKLAAQTCPGYGKAHNQLARVTRDDDLEIIFQYMMSIDALEPFPARENLLAAFESSRKKFQALVSAGALGVVRGLPASAVLARFAVQLTRLGGVLYTKIDLDDAGNLFERCLETFHHCLENGSITDGVLIRVAVLCIVLAHKGRLPHNVPFQHEAEVDEDVGDRRRGSSPSARQPASGFNAMSTMTLRAMDLIFEFFGAAARVCARDLNTLRFLAPIAALCTWLQRNAFAVKLAPETDRRMFFMVGLARLANALFKVKKSRAHINSAALDLVSGFAPLGNLPEFADTPRALLQPLSNTLDDDEGEEDEVPPVPEGAWQASKDCAEIKVSNQGKTASCRGLARWQTIMSNAEVPVHNNLNFEDQDNVKGDVVLLDKFSTADNNYAAVVGIVPIGFPSDARLPIGWKLPGFGIICGTGETLGSEQGGCTQYSSPLQKGDEIGVYLRQGGNSSDEGTLEFTRNGKSLGLAFTGVDLTEKYKLAISLIKTQSITLAAPGHSLRAAKKREKALVSEALEKHRRNAKTQFPLQWQIRAVVRAARSVLMQDETSGRFVVPRSVPAPEMKSPAEASSDGLPQAPADSRQNGRGEAVLPEHEREGVAIEGNDKSTGTTSSGAGADAKAEPQSVTRATEIMRGKKGGMVMNSDLVAIARARAARAREEAEATQLVENIMTATKQNNSLSEAKGEAGGAAEAVKEASSKSLLVLDLPNICMRHGMHKKFSCAGIQICIDYFRKRGFKQLVAFVPEHLLDYEHASKHRHLVRLGMEKESKVKTKLPDNISLLLSLEEEGYVVPTPSQDYDDSYCIKYAFQHGGYVVTNDKYRDCNIEGITRDWRRTHLMTFTFVNDEFIPNPDFVFR